MSSPHRVLITGAGGFVGPHLVTALRRAFGGAVSILGTGLKQRDDPLCGRIAELDVTDPQAVRAVVAQYQPTHVVNLAAIAAPRLPMLTPPSAGKFTSMLPATWQMP